MKILTLLIITFLINSFECKMKESEVPTPQVSHGSIDRIENFNSQYVSPRNIDIWLPQGYNTSKKYAVLYMHDGQMLFDSSITWNKQAWEVDVTLHKLFQNPEIRKCIVVGIWNSGNGRHADYFPQKPFEHLSKADRDTVSAQLQKTGKITEDFKPLSDRYLKFIVNELQPYIDKKYAVFTNRENTFISGSSMGGLISMYALCEYPDVFGGAACLSTHWVGTFTLTNNPVPESFIRYLSENLPENQGHKMYFDCGDKTLDALYPPIQQKVDSVMRLKGYNENNWITEYFPGDDHSEKSWSKRLHIPMEFLLRRSRFK